MSAGSIVAQGSLQELRSQGVTRLTLEVSDVELAWQTLESFDIEAFEKTSDGLRAEVPSNFDSARLNAKLVANGIEVRQLRLDRPSLEEYFVGLTGAGFEVVR
jgi:ABC-2 type transport system ATP-binding protein